MKHYTLRISHLKAALLGMALTVLTFACQAPDQPQSQSIGTPLPTTAAPNLNDIMAPFTPPTQTFKVSSKRPSVVTGKAGTKIHVVPARLETAEGAPVTGEIEVRLIECTRKSDLLGAGLQTVSNGKLLESGGSYFLDMQANGIPLKIKEGQSLNVEFPKLTDADMELFYGAKDAAGQVNWEVAGVPFVTAPRDSGQNSASKGAVSDTVYTYLSEGDTVVSDQMEDIWAYLEGEDGKHSKAEIKQFNKELAREQRQREADRARFAKQQAAFEKNADFVYEGVDVSRFGWYNCDRFINESNVVPVVAELPTAKQPGILYFVLRSRNAIIQSSYVPGSASQVMVNLPSGEAIEVLAMEGRDEAGKCGFARQQLTIGKDAHVSLRPVATDIAKVKQAMAAL